MDSDFQVGGKAYLQAAALYTDVSGQPRVRVYTYCLWVTDHPGFMVKSLDGEAVLNHMMRRCVEIAASRPLAEVKEFLEGCVKHYLYLYRRDGATSSVPGQLILPDSLRYVLGAVAGFLKSPAARPNVNPTATIPGGTGRTASAVKRMGVRADERLAVHLHITGMSIADTIPLVYPRVFALHNMGEEGGMEVEPTGLMPEDGPVRYQLPKELYPSARALELDGVFALSCLSGVFVVVGERAGSDVLRDLFGVDSVDVLPAVPQWELRDNLRSKQAHNVVQELRSALPPGTPVTVVLTNGPLRASITPLLADDKLRTCPGYGELLVLCHSYITEQFR
jgi:protein transport protein SEC24